MGLKFHAFVFVSAPLLCFSGLHFVRCLTNDASSSPPAIPTGSAGLPRMTAVSTPLLRPLPQPNPMASLPISSPTVQPTRPTELILSTSCSAHAQMISPAHAQLFLGATPPNLRPTALTASFESACYSVVKNVSV